MTDYPPDPRLEEARSLPIDDVWDRLGAPTKLSNGNDRAGPCPRCGGRDRFSINTVKNVWLCRSNNGGCGESGDVISLVRHVMGCDFKDALAFLAGERDLQVSPAELERRAAAAARRREEQERASEWFRRQAINHARRIWAASSPADGTPAQDYLELRGVRLKYMPKAVRYIDDHPYIRGGGRNAVRCHSGPCMVAAIETPKMGLTAVHQTWIDLDQPKGKADIVHPDTGEVMKAKLVRGKMFCGAIRLISSPRLMQGDGGVMVVGEGIETTATAWSRRGAPGASYWCGVSLGHMSGRIQRGKGLKYKGLPILDDDNCFRPPKGLSHLIFIQDGDSDPRSTTAALQAGLRRAEVRQPGLRISIVHPGDGVDLNDLVMADA